MNDSDLMERKAVEIISRFTVKIARTHKNFPFFVIYIAHTSACISGA